MKILLFASHQMQVINFLKIFKLNAKNYKFIRCYEDLHCCHWDSPVILLEGYQWNKDYTSSLMQYVGHRFNNIGFISEGELWEHEEVPIQYCHRT
jgi:hypothetical protein